MRHACKFLILVFLLLITANSSYGEYQPKRPAVRVERPEISFELVQASGGVMKVRMKNNGTAPFPYYNEFAPHRSYDPEFRVCQRTSVDCSESEWINPNFRVSQLIILPAQRAELEPGGSIVKTIHIPAAFSSEGTYSIVGGYEQKPGERVVIEFTADDHLQAKFEVMLTPYFEEYIEYVSDWIPVETLMRP